MAQLRPILMATHSPLLTTGYGRVARELARALSAAGHAVTVLAYGYGGEAHDKPYELLQCASLEDLQVISGAIARVMAKRGEPPILLTVGDPWMFAGLERLVRPAGVTWIAYFPVDGSPIPAEWKRWIGVVDVPVTFCNWTRELVRRDAQVEAAVIPHGVDLRVFSPQDKARAKARVGVMGKFVVGTVAVNQQRKNLPALVRAFAAFAKEKADAVLYLHTRVDGYWDIEELVQRFGVEPKTRATLNLDPLRGVDDATLATIYNSFDVFALPTMGEGFGLPILESQACGVPALATDCSACSELLPDARQRLGVKGTLIMARNFEQAIVDEEDLTARLEILYANRAVLREMGARSLEFAKGFSWERVAGEFVELMGRI